MKKVIAVILFKIGWLSCVFARQEGLESYVPFIILAILFTNYKYLLKHPFRTLPFHILFAIAGMGMDLVLLEFGALKSIPEGPLFPGWLFYLWLIFPLNFFHYFDFLDGKKWLAMILGAVGGPLAYSVGPSVGLVEFNEYSMIFIAIGYTVFFLFAQTIKDWFFKSEIQSESEALNKGTT